MQQANCEQEREALIEAVRELHWMARRYADGRMTYVTSLLNETTRRLLALGVELPQPDGTPWARDGQGRGFDGLSNEEAALGKAAFGALKPEMEVVLASILVEAGASAKEGLYSRRWSYALRHVLMLAEELEITEPDLYERGMAFWRHREG